VALQVQTSTDVSAQDPVLQAVRNERTEMSEKEALVRIIEILGPNPGKCPDIGCEGCSAEIETAYWVACETVGQDWFDLNGVERSAGG